MIVREAIVSDSNSKIWGEEAVPQCQITGEKQTNRQMCQLFFYLSPFSQMLCVNVSHMFLNTFRVRDLINLTCECNCSHGDARDLRWSHMPYVVSSRGLCLTGQVSSHQTSSELLNTSSGHPVDTDTKKWKSLFDKKSIFNTENRIKFFVL